MHPVHAQQILKYIHGHIRALFNQLRQVFTNDFAEEVRIQKRINVVGFQWAVLHIGLRNHY